MDAPIIMYFRFKYYVVNLERIVCIKDLSDEKTICLKVSFGHPSETITLTRNRQSQDDEVDYAIAVIQEFTTKRTYPTTLVRKVSLAETIEWNARTAAQRTSTGTKLTTE